VTGLSTSQAAYFHAFARLLQDAQPRAREAYVAALEASLREDHPSARAKVQEAERHLLQACQWVRRTNFDDHSTHFLALALQVHFAAVLGVDRSRVAALAGGKRSGKVRGARAREAIQRIVAKLRKANIPRREWVDRIAPRLKKKRIPLGDRAIQKHLTALGFPGQKKRN
jgi:hypothetical protein